MPPSMRDWGDEIPPFPGNRALLGFMKYNCHFDTTGSCKPINVAKLLAGSPMADASLQTSPSPQYPLKIRQQPLVIGPKSSRW